MAKLNIENKNMAEWQDLPNYKIWLRNKDNFPIESNVLRLKMKNGESLIVVPSGLRARICHAFHDSIGGSHLGYEKTVRSIVGRFYWPGMKSDIYDYCESCDICQKFKPKNYANKWPMISIKTDKPWSMVGIDVAGPLKLTRRGNRYFIIAVDHFQNSH